MAREGKREMATLLALTGVNESWFVENSYTSNNSEMQFIELVKNSLMVRILLRPKYHQPTRGKHHET